MRLRHRDGVAVVALESPPLNVLGQPVRAALLSALEAALALPGLSALVLTAAGDRFSAGLDQRDEALAFASPPLDAINARLDRLAAPVIAALPGPAAGAGTDLALAAHYRLAPATATLGVVRPMDGWATLGLVRAMDGWATLDPLWEVPPLMRRAALAHGGFAAAVRPG